MSYRIQKIGCDRAWEHAREYPYALVYFISELILCKTQELPDIDWSECLEARFFGPDGELHIYEEDGGFQAVQVKEEGGDFQAVQVKEKGGSLHTVQGVAKDEVPHAMQGIEKDGVPHAVQGIEGADGLQDVEKGEPDYMDRRYQLAKKFRGAGALLRVREYLSYDEDGQVFVSLTRLAGIEEV